ncbi:MAG: hypothetical protein LQ339_003181 [Xanthoria mediterranea]|nr:MAG: hypothetical protein LQ339_003181 [Xanthoria mediterranea]
MPPTKDAAATDFDTPATTSRRKLLDPKTTTSVRRSPRLRSDHPNHVRQERAACPAESTQAVRSVPGQVGEKARGGRRGEQCTGCGPKGFLVYPKTPKQSNSSPATRNTNKPQAEQGGARAGQRGTRG